MFASHRMVRYCCLFSCTLSGNAVGGLDCVAESGDGLLADARAAASKPDTARRGPKEVCTSFGPSGVCSAGFNRVCGGGGGARRLTDAAHHSLLIHVRLISRTSAYGMTWLTGQCLTPCWPVWMLLGCWVRHVALSVSRGPMPWCLSAMALSEIKV